MKKPEELDTFVAELTSQLAAGPPIAMAESKALLNEASSQTFREVLESEARAQVVNFATDEPAATRAFLGKTNPSFEGDWQV